MNEIVGIDPATGLVRLRWPTTKPYHPEFYPDDTYSDATQLVVTAYPAPWGIQQIQLDSLSNISVCDLRFERVNGTGPQLPAVHVHAVLGLTLERCISTGGSFTVIGESRFVTIRDIRKHAVDGTGSYDGLATGTTDILVEGLDSPAESGVASWHQHEGVAAFTMRGGVFRSRADEDDAQAVISVLGRAYDQRWEGVQIVGSGSSAPIDLASGNVHPVRAGEFVAPSVQPSSAAGSSGRVKDRRWRVIDPDTPSSKPILIVPPKSSHGWIEPYTLQAMLTYSDAGQTIVLGRVPMGTVVLSVRAVVIVAFNSDGTDHLDVGYTGFPNLYANDIDVSTTGAKNPPAITAPSAYISLAGDLIASYAAGGSAATTGQVLVLVECVEAVWRY